jgi:hypothetical protein
MIKENLIALLVPQIILNELRRNRRRVSRRRVGSDRRTVEISHLDSPVGPDPVTCRPACSRLQSAVPPRKNSMADVLIMACRKSLRKRVFCGDVFAREQISIAAGDVRCCLYGHYFPASRLWGVAAVGQAGP